MLSVYANFDSFGLSIKCTFRMAAMHFAAPKLICKAKSFPLIPIDQCLLAIDCAQEMKHKNACRNI